MDYILLWNAIDPITEADQIQVSTVHVSHVCLAKEYWQLASTVLDIALLLFTDNLGICMWVDQWMQAVMVQLFWAHINVALARADYPVVVNAILYIRYMYMAERFEMHQPKDARVFPQESYMLVWARDCQNFLPLMCSSATRICDTYAICDTYIPYHPTESYLPHTTGQRSRKTRVSTYRLSTTEVPP